MQGNVLLAVKGILLLPQKCDFCRYDPEMNQWVSLCPMNSRRLGVGLAVCGGCLYAIGGSDGSAPLATAERYFIQVCDLL